MRIQKWNFLSYVIMQSPLWGFAFLKIHLYNISWTFINYHIIHSEWLNTSYRLNPISFQSIHCHHDWIVQWIVQWRRGMLPVSHFPMYIVFSEIILAEKSLHTGFQYWYNDIMEAVCSQLKAYVITTFYTGRTRPDNTVGVSLSTWQTKHT